MFYRSNVIAQHELFRTRLEIRLISQILDVVLPDIMPDQSDWGDERDQAPAIIANHLNQFLALRGAV